MCRDPFRAELMECAEQYGRPSVRWLLRFPEDLDFTLLEAGDDTRVERYLPGVATELESLGFLFEAEPKSGGEATGIE